MCTHIADNDICSLYAYGFLSVKQSLINKVTKQTLSGKSHRAKINAKRRLKTFNYLLIDRDVEPIKEQTRIKTLNSNKRFLTVSNPSI